MITSARILSQSPQADGRVYVVEIQTDDTSGDQQFLYLALPDDNPTAIMQARTVAINAAINAIPTVTVTMQDGTTATIKTYEFGNMSLVLTASQRTAMQTAQNVIDAVRPLIRIYNNLTPAQQQFVINHTPWFAQALEAVNGG